MLLWVVTSVDPCPYLIFIYNDNLAIVKYKWYNITLSLLFYQGAKQNYCLYLINKQKSNGIF